MIEYQYDFWMNYGLIGNPDLFFMWVVPFVLLILAKEYKNIRFKLIVIAVSSFVIILGVHKYYVGKRFVLFEPESSEVRLVNGDVLKININDVSHFWSIKLGKFRGHSCYMWIQMKKGKDIRSVNVSNKNRRCLHDANSLNEKFNK